MQPPHLFISYIRNFAYVVVYFFGQLADVVLALLSLGHSFIQFKPPLENLKNPRRVSFYQVPRNNFIFISFNIFLLLIHI